jgi:hypothetical protein
MGLRLKCQSNRTEFAGQYFVQTLGSFFKGVHVCVEGFLHFSWREICDSIVEALRVVPIDPFQRSPFLPADGFPGSVSLCSLELEQADNALR